MNRTNTNNFVTNWVLDTIKEKYADDIALVVSHTTLRLDHDPQVMSYFVPITDKGRSFAQTFILEGIGFDIWGIEWERLEQFAALNEYNITVLADAQVLYARTPADKERFEALKALQAQNMADPVRQRAHALEAFAQAKQIYFEMLFASSSDVKTGAAYVIDYLARAICYSQGGYFRRSQTDQLAELREISEIPEGFAETYNAIIREKDENTQKKKCFQLIRIVEHSLTRPETITPQEYNFQDLADWYGELSYTWLRIRHYCKEGDITKTYMWGSMLQEELNCVCKDFGLTKMELMAQFDAANLPAFAEHANALETEICRRITEGGGKIREYKTREEFLHEV